MNELQATLRALTDTTRFPGPIERWARAALLRRLAGLSEGTLILDEAGSRHRFGTPGTGLDARISVRDPAFFVAVALRGSVGAGEAWARGHWTSEDPTTVMRLVLRNRALMGELDSGWARASAPLLRAWHRLRDNTRVGSRRNISAHYDLGNDFFELFLDETMTYSCGIFEGEQSTLEEASVAKLDRACRKLRLKPTDHLLEVGTGWGSLALHAAGRYGCRVTTTTISRRQHDLASERIRAAGLQDRVTLLLEDYRDLRGTFDKIVSIEMIEAVGYRHLDAYFRACCDRLAPDGLMLLQAITIADQHHDRHRRNADYIKRHVFPGSHIPSVAVLSGCVARATDFRMVHLEDLTPHYVRTLAEWRRNLLTNRERIRELGYGEELLRGWEFYLTYCEAGFAERYLGDVQLLLARPESRHEALLPPLPVD